MNADPDVQRGRRIVKNAEAYLDDLRIEEMSLVERVETDSLVEDGVASTREICEGLGLHPLA